MSKPTISVIIPVFNEKKTIKEIVRRVQKINIKKEIIIVDDFSTDGTREILKKIRQKNLRVFFHNENHGQGYAFRTGFKHARGEIIICQDADLEYNPRDYPQLIEPLLNKEAEVVYGSRKFGKTQYNFMDFPFSLGRLLLTFIANLLYRIEISDEATGYKVFRTKLIQSIKLNSEGFEFSPEVTAKIAKRGIKIHEVPISYSPRTFSQGKKITWKDGIIAIYTLIRYRFTD